MSDVHHFGRRPVLAGIGAAALGTLFNPKLVRAQALDRPPSVLVFDVTESLLDLQALRPLFQRVFGEGATVDEWFGETILYSESACMVACHTWGTMGAQAAGWQAGLIKRVNNDVLDTAAQPQYVGKDLGTVEDQIIARNGRAAPAHG